MEPDFVLVGSLKTQAVVLQVVFSNQDGSAVTGVELLWLASTNLALLFTLVLSLNVTLFLQFQADFLNICRGGEFNLVLNIFKVVDFSISQFELLINVGD